jgi:hypothetical protein
LYITQQGCPYPGALHLKSLGLLTIELELTILFQERGAILRYHGHRYALMFTGSTPPHALHCYLLTNTGKELYQLSGAQPDFEYVSTLADSMAHIVSFSKLVKN